MKIGLVCPYNIVRGGGVQECVVSLQAEFQHRGHTVRIITPEPRAYTGKRPQGVIFIGGAADIKSPFHTTAQISASTDMTALDKMLERENFDILHFHEPWVPMLSRQILSRSRAVHIATFHAKLPETVMSRTIERVITPYTRSIIKHFAALTAVSDAAAEYVRSVSNAPVQVIPNSVNLKKYLANNYSDSEDNLRILFIGRLENRKGIKYLLHAFELLTRNYPDARLTIAGEGPDRRKLENLARLLKLTNVTFTGYISEVKKIELLHTHELFCSPALYGESFGIVLLEAMACGLVTIAGDNVGYSGLLKERGGLSLVNPKDITAFARHLELMLTDSKLRKLWRSWAQNYVQQFDVSRVSNQYEQLYKLTLSKAV